MNREEITRMAQEAGFVGFDGENKCLREFAALVAAAEHEKVSAWMIQRSYATGHGDTTEDLLKELEWQIAERVAAEREECAKVCESYIAEGIGREMAEAIRARGQAITAICEALAEQPAQQQEPVATVQCINGITIGYLEVMQPVGTKLYTTPSQRQWQGLTDDELHGVIRAGGYDSMEEFARAIEAKLKEKNG